MNGRNGNFRARHFDFAQQRQAGMRGAEWSNGRSGPWPHSSHRSSPHRLSLAGCSPAEPASVSPDHHSLRFEQKRPHDAYAMSSSTRCSPRSSRRLTSSALAYLRARLRTSAMDVISRFVGTRTATGAGRFQPPSPRRLPRLLVSETSLAQDAAAASSMPCFLGLGAAGDRQ